MPLHLKADPAFSPGGAGAIPAASVPAELAALRGCDRPASSSSVTRIPFWASFLGVGGNRGVCPSFLLNFVRVPFGGILWVHLSGSDWRCLATLNITKAQHEVWQQVTVVYQDTQQKQSKSLASSSVCDLHECGCNLGNRGRVSTAENNQTYGSLSGHLTAVCSIQYAPQTQARHKSHAKSDTEHLEFTN